MDNDNILIGVLLSCIFILAALWHIRENTRFEREIKSKTDEITADWLVRFLWFRTLQLLAALGAAIVVFISYDKQLIESRTNLENLTEIVEKRAKLDKLNAQNNTSPAAAQPARPAVITANQPEPRPIIKAPNPLLQQQRQAGIQTVPQPAPSPAPATQVPPPAAQTIPAPAAAPAPAQPAQPVPAQPVQAAPPPATQPADTDQEEAVLPDNNQLPSDALQGGGSINGKAASAAPGASNNAALEALYNPERSQSDQQSGMDDIKKRYEDILVIHLFLKKCNKTSPGDYQTISNALTQEMARINAPAKLQTDVIASAQGSYNEIYANSACDSAGVDNLINQYNNYINVLATNYPQH